MSRLDRPQLGWKRPPEWDRFEEAVEEEYGATSPYRGFVLEQTWREYRDDHPAEEYADRLLRSVGSRGRPTREKNLSRTASVETDRQVWVSVSKEVKSEMEQFATEAGVPNHEVLRAVMCWYLDGGLLGHLTKKFEKAVPKAEKQLADLDPDDDRGRTAEEKKRDWLAKWVVDNRPGGFNRDDFGRALESMPYRGGDTEFMGEKWLPKVLDQLDYRPLPDNRDVFMPEEEVREFTDEEALDAPAIDRLPYADLSGEERVHGLRIEAVRKAEGRTNGRYALRVEEVRGEVFDGGPSKRKVKDLMDRAARTDGFSNDVKGEGKRLKVDLSEAGDGLLSDAGFDASEDDATDTEDVAGQMDALMDATAVTDGGREDP